MPRSTSQHDNVDLRYRLMPAVEWSLFPYREATRRQLTIAYRAGASHIAYRDTTIYDEIEQLLPEHTLTAGYAVTERWGQIDVGIDASQYLHEVERYSLRFDASIDVRLTQGLSVEQAATWHTPTTSRGSIFNNIVNPRLIGGRNQDHF